MIIKKIIGFHLNYVTVHIIILNSESKTITWESANPHSMFKMFVNLNRTKKVIIDFALTILRTIQHEEHELD